MPIQWSAVKVSEAMDMTAEFVSQAAEPLEQAEIVARQARTIAHLPGYLDQRLIRLITQIERIDNVKEAIKAVRNAIPDGAIKAEQENLRHGRQLSIV